MCLDDQILNSYIDGELAEPWKTQVEEHLNHCRACQKRCENLTHFREVVKNAVVSDETVNSSKERVLAILEKNYINKPKKSSPFSKQIKFKLSQLIGVAAAFTVVFIGSWTLLGSDSDKAIPMGNNIPAVIDVSNITQTKSVTKETPKSLNDYSLEQILQYLDAKGYNVELTLKGIEPIEEIEKIRELNEEVPFN